MPELIFHVISTVREKSQIWFYRSIDKHKPIATRTALTLSVLRATYRCLYYLRHFDNACIYKHYLRYFDNACQALSN